jgi:hypothetical protein
MYVVARRLGGAYSINVAISNQHLILRTKKKYKQYFLWMNKLKHLFGVVKEYCLMQT